MKKKRKKKNRRRTFCAKSREEGSLERVQVAFSNEYRCSGRCELRARKNQAASLKNHE